MLTSIVPRLSKDWLPIDCLKYSVIIIFSGLSANPRLGDLVGCTHRDSLRIWSNANDRIHSDAAIITIHDLEHLVLRIFVLIISSLFWMVLSFPGGVHRQFFCFLDCCSVFLGFVLESFHYWGHVRANNDLLGRLSVIETLITIFLTAQVYPALAPSWISGYYAALLGARFLRQSCLISKDVLLALRMIYDIDSGLVFGHYARLLHWIAAIAGQFRGSAVKVIAHVARQDLLMPLAH